MQADSSSPNLDTAGTRKGPVGRALYKLAWIGAALVGIGIVVLIVASAISPEKIKALSCPSQQPHVVRCVVAEGIPARLDVERLLTCASGNGTNELYWCPTYKLTLEFFLTEYKPLQLGLDVNDPKVFDARLFSENATSWTQGDLARARDAALQSVPLYSSVVFLTTFAELNNGTDGSHYWLAAAAGRLIILTDKLSVLSYVLMGLGAVFVVVKMMDDCRREGCCCCCCCPKNDGGEEEGLLNSGV
jgi:hypothetical protein